MRGFPAYPQKGVTTPRGRGKWEAPNSSYPRLSPRPRVEVSSSGSRRNVLVHAEEIRRIVPGFYLLETAVVRAVGSFDAGRAFFHHEIDVSTGGRVRVDGVPIGAGPIGDLVLVGGIGVDAHDHCRPFGAS